jgi:hypothetical protein
MTRIVKGGLVPPKYYLGDIWHNLAQLGATWHDQIQIGATWLNYEHPIACWSKWVHTRLKTRFELGGYSAQDKR